MYYNRVSKAPPTKKVNLYYGKREEAIRKSLLQPQP